MDAFFFIVIIVIAAMLQTSTGFGFSILATPFLLLLYLPYEAVQINIILALVVSLVIFHKIQGEIDTALLKRFIVGSVMGVPFGILLFLSVNITTFKLGVGLLLLILAILLMVKVRVKSTPTRDFIVGGISGALTTSIGMPGPPLLIYFTSTDTEKGKLRATTLAYYLFIFFVSLITQISFVGTAKTVWLSSLYAVPLVFIGLIAGQKIFERVNQALFRRFLYIILIGTSLVLLGDSLLH